MSFSKHCFPRFQGLCICNISRLLEDENRVTVTCPVWLKQKCDGEDSQDYQFKTDEIIAKSLKYAV